MPIIGNSDAIIYSSGFIRLAAPTNGDKIKSTIPIIMTAYLLKNRTMRDLSSAFFITNVDCVIVTYHVKHVFIFFDLLSARV